MNESTSQYQTFTLFIGHRLKLSRIVLQRTNFFSLQAFLALSYTKLNTLTFSQSFEAFSSDLTEVGKHVENVI